MSNKLYDLLKVVGAIIALIPAFVLDLGDIWGWAWATPVASTISKIAGLLTAILIIISKNYFKNKDIVDKVE